MNLELFGLTVILMDTVKLLCIIRHGHNFANYLKGRSGISYVYSFIGGKGSAEASSKPTNVILSKNQYWYDLKDTITLTPSSNGATSYVMSVEKDGKRIIDCISLNGAYSLQQINGDMANTTLGFLRQIVLEQQIHQLVILR